jgi:hypothetical protein
MGKRRQRRKQSEPIILSIRLVEEQPKQGVPEPERVWVQVAAEGNFKGYAGGAVEFTFDSRVFEKIIANFRRHPSYVRGADGYGAANVIPWDFHHASEMGPTDGTIPSTGAPAQGWIQELAVRFNAEGKAELWALTKWLEPAKTYIKEGRYQWASVSVVFDAIDARTGNNIGPILTSVALTNQPFIEGMQKLAAERYLRSKGMYIEAAETPEKALDMIRGMLGMPETAEAAAVMGELEKVKQWVTSGTVPLGVDLDEIVGGLRTILNLPSLSTNEEVFVEVDKLVSRLMGDSGVSGGGLPPLPEGSNQLPPEGTPPPPPDMAPAPLMENRDMELLKALAEKFGVVAKPEAVTEAVDQLLELRGAVAKNVGLEKTASTKVVLKAALDDSSVRAKFGPILSALGVEDPDGAMDKIAGLMEESAKLAEVAPEFAALKKRADEIEAAEQEEEVEMAVASTGVAASSDHYEGLKVALTHLRKSNPKEFAARYPKEKLDAQRAKLGRSAGEVKTLTSRIAAGGDAGKSGGTGNGNDKPGAGNVIDLSGFSGPNITMKACAFVCQQEGITLDAAKKDHSKWLQVTETASKLVRSGAVTG